MKDRKQHVIEMSHRLLMDKGFQATSIQDILDYSGISKGTFYNYFASKNELLIAIFKKIFAEIEIERESLLIGKDPSDINIFIKQVELHMELNRSKQLTTLFEEAFFTRDEELKEFIKIRHFEIIRWLYTRFLSIFGDEKKPYLLDGAIMFQGILNNSNKYYSIATEKTFKSHHQLVKFCVHRLVNVVEGAASADEKLLDYTILDTWIPNNEYEQKAFQLEVQKLIFSLKKTVSQSEEAKKYFELLDFLYDELMNSNNPRIYLIESILSSLLKDEEISNSVELSKLEVLIQEYFSVQ